MPCYDPSVDVQAVVSLKRKAAAVAMTSKAMTGIATKVTEPIHPFVIAKKFVEIPITCTAAKDSNCECLSCSSVLYRFYLFCGPVHIPNVLYKSSVVPLWKIFQ